MKRLLLYIVLFSLSHLSQAQAISGKWTKELIDKANTAKNADYLSEEEKKIIFIANLARLDGKLFSETFLADYLEKEKPTKYSRSLIRDLKNIRNLRVFMPATDLYAIAADHADTSGKRGTTGHQRFEKRFKPLLGKYTEVAENCAYGYDRAIDIVIRLLIDEGIPDLGHRKNLLNPKLDSLGVSIKPHKKYRYNCVMDFGALSR